MEIPLFPLPRLVAFPQVAVPLHIFEERYKLMINRCIDQNSIFGLVLLQDGAEEESESTICRVGVACRVVQVDRMDDGRLNILCAAESRFRIQEFTARKPYWTGIAEFFEDEPEDQSGLKGALEEVARLYKQATLLTSRVKEQEIPELDFPDSATAASFMVSYILDLSSARKQELLEVTSTLLRLDALASEIEKMISTLQEQLQRKGLGAKAKTNGDLGKPH
jgi:Lon protease-like protein